MISYGFSGRDEGDMRNTKRLVDYLQRKYKNVTVVRPRQVHGSTIAVYEESLKHDEPMYSIGDTDGVLTRKKNIALTVITADCVPVVYFSEKFEMVGVSHQGWKGLLARLPEKMVAKMIELGCEANDIHASIGPSINACCYEIHQDRAIKFRSEFPLSKAIINQGSNYFLNLTMLAYEQLIESGVPSVNIERKISCTSCQIDKYYSYRKAKNKDDFEEQVSYIVQT